MNTTVMLLSLATHNTDRSGLFNMSYTTAYLLCIAAFVLSLIASAGVKLTFSKYSKKLSSAGITAEKAARAILDANGLTYIGIQPIGGNLTDHFDPRTNVVSLSSTVYASTSIAAIGVAAHECGHAIQHAKGYLPIKIRSAIVPIANIGSQAYIYLFILGLILNFGILVNIGIALFAFVVLFQLVTLPVELNASARAMKTLKSMGILTASELPAAGKTLRAAAMTYVAALAVSITQLLRLLARANSRRR